MGKIYTFRIIRDKDEEGLYDSDDMSQKYPLYAWTAKKKIAKRFMMQRNMARFIPITIRKDDVEEANKWFKIHHSYKLDEYEFETYIHRNTKKQDVQFAVVVATDNEMTLFNEVTESGSIVSDLIPVFIPLEIFSDELRETMEVIGLADAMMIKFTTAPIDSPTAVQYMEGSKLANTMDIREDVYDKLGMIEGMDINRMDAKLTIDQLAAFVRLNKDLLADDFGEMIEIKQERGY